MGGKTLYKDGRSITKRILYYVTVWGINVHADVVTAIVVPSQLLGAFCARTEVDESCQAAHITCFCAILRSKRRVTCQCQLCCTHSLTSGVK